MRTMPAVFFGHGWPANAIEDNEHSRAFARVGATLPRPRAAIVVSAHFETEGTWVTHAVFPGTLRDVPAIYGGRLSEVTYAAPGDPALAASVAAHISGAGLVSDRGLDHGVWSVLRHVWPDADVPIVQVSIDRRLPRGRHAALGRALGALRDEGVMVIGSGNVVHDMRGAVHRTIEASRELHRHTDRTELPGRHFSAVPDPTPPPWAARFDDAVGRAIERRDVAALESLLDTDDGRHAHPSPAHYLPLLYVMGAARPTDRIGFPIVGFDRGTLSMRSVVVDR